MLGRPNIPAARGSGEVGTFLCGCFGETVAGAPQLKRPEAIEGKKMYPGSE